jgi:Protein of unknown function (DUF4235)
MNERLRRGASRASPRRYLWQGVAFGSGTLAALGARRAAVALWRTGRHEDPPIHPAARDVRWHDAMIWAISVAIGTAVARVVAERTAAAAWSAATGAAPPLGDE